jgi:phosphoglucomutase/phosphomannomutase
MDLLARVVEGFKGVEADAAPKERALKYLRQWLSESDFAPYRPQLEWLIGTGQWSGLLDRFYQILPFGTGGRRGPVGVGPNRMNPWTLGASVQGHCEYLRERFPGVEPLRVVLAYDVRQFEDKRKQYNPELPNPVLHLSSRAMAQYAAGVYIANGIHASILPAESKQYLATPELSFTIRHLSAHGGLNVSASHNPPDDNGGKFYDERGGQPVPPDDQIMADLVDQVKGIKALPWAEALRTGRVHLLDEAPHRAYIELCRRQSLVAPPKADDFKVVFTPLHGVGAMTAMEVLTEQGFRVVPVAEQMTPDGQFPNVTRSPNPEVPESMDRAAALALRHQADLVLATDPDADRLGAMVPSVRSQESGVRSQGSGGGEQGVAGSSSALTPDPCLLTPGQGMRFVTGNELAALLTHFKLNKLSQTGRLPKSPIVVRTEVTTGQITRIARHFGAQVIDNLLVGFKYVADVLWRLEQDGAYEDVTGTPADFVLATEESHGALVTPHIRDKDAGGAALLMAELALDQKRRGQTVLDYLDRLAKEFGYFRNEGVPVFMTGLQGKEQMARMLNELRKAPPKEIAGQAVTGFEDLRDEDGRFGPLKGATDAASRNVLVFRCGSRAKVVLRPSGTEPKAKIYLEASTPPCPPGKPADVWRRECRETDELVRRLSEDFVRQALAKIGLDPSAAGAR